MNKSTKPTTSITVGIVVTVLATIQIVATIMDGGVFSEITLKEFLSTPRNTIFTIYVAILLFGVWLLRGSNNKTVYLFW